jgi:hypothetical protein
MGGKRADIVRRRGLVDLALGAFVCVLLARCPSLLCRFLELISRFGSALSPGNGMLRCGPGHQINLGTWPVAATISTTPGSNLRRLPTNTDGSRASRAMRQTVVRSQPRIAAACVVVSMTPA